MTPFEVETIVLAETYRAKNLPDFSPWLSGSRWVSITKSGIGTLAAARLIFPEFEATPTELAIGREIPDSVDIASFCVLKEHAGMGYRLMRQVIRYAKLEEVGTLTAVVSYPAMEVLTKGLQAASKGKALTYLRAGSFDYLGYPDNYAIALDVSKL